MVQNPLQDGPKSLKIELWGCLGTLWGRSWRQDGSRSTPRAKIDEKSSILGWLVGSKMGPKSMKNRMKNHIDFYNDFETIFSRFWDDFGSKNLPKMKGPGSLFEFDCEYAKSVILNNPPMVLLYFSTLEAMIFDFKSNIFQSFFQMRSGCNFFTILCRF